MAAAPAGADHGRGGARMEWTLEVVAVPVTDLDRAKAFYRDRCGFRADVDASFFEGVGRFVQLTPPGSHCSIVLESGLPDSPGGPGCSPVRSRACNCASRTSRRPGPSWRGAAWR
ncbi:hypothetical protein GCM10020295_55830 [Streptomyces cinereospinus]